MRIYNVHAIVTEEDGNGHQRWMVRTGDINRVMGIIHFPLLHTIITVVDTYTIDVTFDKPDMEF